MKGAVWLAAACALAVVAGGAHQCGRWSEWSACATTAGGEPAAARLAGAACARGAHARARRAADYSFWDYVRGVLGRIKEKIAAKVGMDVQQPEADAAAAVRERNALGGSLAGAPDQSDATAEADRVAGITAERIAGRQSPSLLSVTAPPADAVLSRVNEGMVAFRDRATAAVSSPDEQGIAVGETVGGGGRFAAAATDGRLDKIRSQVAGVPEAPSVAINKESVFNKDTSSVAKRSAEPPIRVSARCCLDSMDESAPSEWQICGETGQ